ncbi:MAG: exodeoxyribonuclease VII large subunit [Breznakia sp.]
MSDRIIRIGQLVNYMKRQIDQDIHLRKLMVSGEISNFTKHRSGHFYFSLKDNDAKMNCVMFKSYAMNVQMNIQEGMKVIVSCSVSMYEAQGSIQLYVHALQSDGLGDLYLAFEQLKEKLNAQGLFLQEHKQALPSYPMNIGVISARTGAAIQDVISILKRRWPICTITLYPSLVQGSHASRDIIKHLEIADTKHHDLILLVRGGGSIEDLWCFNDEQLAHTIYRMQTCIVSGVGHEVDTTLVDYVSDARAPTPSAAAELVSPNIQDVLFQLSKYQRQLNIRMRHAYETYESVLHSYKEKAYFKDGHELLKDMQVKFMMQIARLSAQEVYTHRQRRRLQGYTSALSQAATQAIIDEKHATMAMKELLKQSLRRYQQQKENQWKRSIELMEAYNPLAILKRGYSITSKNYKIVRSIHDVKHGDEVAVRLSDGYIKAKVIQGDNKNERE